MFLAQFKSDEEKAIFLAGQMMGSSKDDAHFSSTLLTVIAYEDRSQAHLDAANWIKTNIIAHNKG